MKKLPFLLILILVISSITSAKAQLIKSIGIRTGWCSTIPNVTTLRTGVQNPEKYYNLNLVYIEVQTEYLQRGNLSLLTNVSYIPKGYSYFSSRGGGYGFFSSTGTGGGKTMLSANADYINLTFTPKYSYYLNNFSIYGFAGVQSGFLTEYDSGFGFAIYSHNPNSYNPNYETELALNRITLGGTVGAGIETKRNNKRINYSLQGQYSHDFTNAANYYKSYYYNGNNYSYLLKMRYQTFLLSFGIHYDLRKNE